MGKADSAPALMVQSVRETSCFQEETTSRNLKSDAKLLANGEGRPSLWGTHRTDKRCPLRSGEAVEFGAGSPQREHLGIDSFLAVETWLQKVPSSSAVWSLEQSCC